MLSHLISQSGAPAGWLAWAALGVAVVSYFLGGFNGAVVVSKFILQDDIRRHGSGNAGLTNFLRTFGGPLTLLVICADAVKALLSVAFGMYIASLISVELITAAKYWAGLFCLLGHMFPATFGFRGGKGILSGGVVALLVDWRVALVVWGGFIILVALTRFVSLGSCWAAASFPVASWFVFRDPFILLLSAVIGGLVLWKHRGNILRLIRGTESKLSFGGHSAAKPDEKIKKPDKQDRPADTPAKPVKEAAKPAKLSGKPAKPTKSKARSAPAEDTPPFILAADPEGPWVAVNDLPTGGWTPVSAPEPAAKPAKQLPPPERKQGAKSSGKQSSSKKRRRK